MERNTLRLLDLTNQLLDFRKTETKGFRLNFMDCNISQLIRDTYIRFNPAAQQNGLKFQTDLPEQDFNAPVDKEALTKILSNLFNNAVKYATSSIHVSLIPPCGMKEPGYFSIMVSNDGHPIPHDMQEKFSSLLCKSNKPPVGNAQPVPASACLWHVPWQNYIKENFT